MIGDAEAFDMLVQMGGGLSWNNQGGFWSCYASNGDAHAYSDDPKDAVIRCHAEWLKEGSPAPVKLPDDECERIKRATDLCWEARKRGFACMGVPDPLYAADTVAVDVDGAA